MGAVKRAASPAPTYTPRQRQALARLSNIRSLCWWRMRHGERPDAHGLIALVDLIVDALRFLHGSGHFTLDREGVLYWVPALWRAHIQTGAIGRALEASRPPWSVASNAEAGRRLRVRAVEIHELAASGSRIALHTIDEDDAARASRRAANRRAIRAAKREAEGKGNETRRFLIKGEPRFVTFRRGSAAEKILDLLARGGASLGEIAARTDTAPSTIKVALSRLVHSGVVERPTRGVYALCLDDSSVTSAVTLDVLNELEERVSRAPAQPSPPAQVLEGRRDAAAGTTNSGPSVTPSQPEPPSETLHTALASVRAEAPDRGPDVDPVCQAEPAAPTPGSGANDTDAKTAGAEPPHPRARLRKAMPADAFAIPFPAMEALHRGREAARNAAPMFPPGAGLFARMAAVMTAIASSTRTAA